MLKFKEINVNPKHRKTGDCSTRALVGVLGVSYEEALKLQFEESLKCFYDPTSKQVMEKVMSKFGYIKMPQPRKWDNTKYEVREIDEVLKQIDLDSGVLVSVANHYTCVKGECVEDIWDCRRKTICNYWVKRGV